MRRVCYRLRGRWPFPAVAARPKGKKGDVPAGGVEVSGRVNARAEKFDAARKLSGKSVNGIGITGSLPAVIRIHFGIGAITGCRLVVWSTAGPRE